MATAKPVSLHGIGDTSYIPTAFKAGKHLRYERPSSTISLSDLDLNFPHASSQTAITSPFPLLTQEGVRELRADIFRPELVGKFGSWKYPGVYRIRGYGPAAPFAYAMWRSTEMIKACSDAAGVDLDIIMDYEIGQLNVQLPKGTNLDDPITENLPPPVPPSAEDEDTVEQEKGADLKDLVSAWHHDSYPWPGMGYAVMMQGSLVSHAALRTLGSGERVTFVVSMRPRDPTAYDNSSLRTVKPISNNDELFRQWTEYRLDVLAKRASAARKELQVEGRSAKEIHRLTKEWVDEQIQYLQTTVDEMDLESYIAPSY
ncbi:hypothetical protein B0I35DRAFT_465295 [Stachybotrys elegans]|uniref:Uncharacterized protein n=1 Tax=Stachybotrys elegans TaxID=80388 RepID=A0A8K0SEK5_9HYPO|nr:hypothetical protein B0I35DRAFT_465295 [Stachybotrys elegans]